MHNKFRSKSRVIINNYPQPYDFDLHDYKGSSKAVVTSSRSTFNTSVTEVQTTILKDCVSISRPNTCLAVFVREVHRLAYKDDKAILIRRNG